MHAYINEKNANRNKQLNTQVNDINRAQIMTKYIQG